MNGKVTPDIVIRYFAGDCTRTEEKAVEKWLQADLDHVRQAQLWLDQENTASASVMDEALMSRTDVWDSLSQAVNTSPRKRIGLLAPMTLAAALIGLIVVAFAYLYESSPGQGEEIVLKTSFGQTSKILLPDSSVVFLNGNSQIRYGASWLGKERELWLEGEAFFDVKHQPNHSRFLVHLPNQKTIQVLGTEFNVSDRSAGSYIVLKSGRIQLDLPGARPALHLKPGDMVEVQESKGQIANIKTTRVDAEAYAMWKEGKWELESTSLNEMLVRLNETYGLDVRARQPDLLTKRASGSIPLPRNDKEVVLLVQDLTTLFQLKASREEGVIYLDKEE